MRLGFFVTTASVAAALTTQAMAQDISGTYSRPNGDTAVVSMQGGKLFCKITAGKRVGFEMCHGMTETGPDVWQGAAMKHPSMPGFMTFNGTVSPTKTGLRIKGCAMGQAMCDAESWIRRN